MSDIYAAIHQKFESAVRYTYQVARRRYPLLLLQVGHFSNSAYAYRFYGSLKLSHDPEEDEDVVVCANVKFADGALEVDGDISLGDGTIVIDWPVEIVACDGQAEACLIEWSAQLAERILAAHDVVIECLACGDV